MTHTLSVPYTLIRRFYHIHNAQILLYTAPHNASYSQMASRRDRLRKIAEETLAVVKKGSYTVPSDGTNCDLRASINSLTSGTLYYSAHSEIITHWTSCPAEYSASSATEVAILEVSTIEGAQFLSNNIASQDLTDKIGILNFASAKKVSHSDQAMPVPAGSSTTLLSLSIARRWLSWWCPSSRRIASTFVDALSVTHDRCWPVVLHYT